MLHYQLSYWEQETFFRDIDIVIVGSGIVGLSAAIYLREQAPGLKVVVLERGPLPIGASTRNAGFACFGSLSELLDDLQHSSEEEVLSLVEQRYRGLQKLRQRYSNQAIGYQGLGGYEIFQETDGKRYEECLDQMTMMNKQLQPIVGGNTYSSTDERINHFGLGGCQHLILNQAEGQLDTGKLMQTLLRKARELEVHCFCGVAVKDIHQNDSELSIETNFGWIIESKQLLVATNGFAQQLLPELTVAPARNQVLVTAPVKDLKLRGCFHYDRGYVYFRNINNRILLGGGRNLNLEEEQTSQFGHTKLIQSYLLQLLQEVILPNQQVSVDQWWSGIMGVGTQKQPIIRELRPGLVAAVRLGGMGVALGTEAGEQAAQLLLG